MYHKRDKPYPDLRYKYNLRRGNFHLTVLKPTQINIQAAIIKVAYTNTGDKNTKTLDGTGMPHVVLTLNLHHKRDKAYPDFWCK